MSTSIIYILDLFFLVNIKTKQYTFWIQGYFFFFDRVFFILPLFASLAPVCLRGCIWSQSAAQLRSLGWVQLSWVPLLAVTTRMIQGRSPGWLQSAAGPLVPCLTKPGRFNSIRRERQQRVQWFPSADRPNLFYFYFYWCIFVITWRKQNVEIHKQ